MSNPFLRKMENFTPLSEDQQRQIMDLTAAPVFFDARESVVHEGDDPTSVNIMMSGWACRQKTLPDGRRQILSLFLPGDMCDPYVFLLGRMDYAIGTLTPCTIAKVEAQSIRDMTASGPQLAEALWGQTLVTLDTQRELSISLGRRTAVERLAHLICEVLARLADVGLSNGTICDWPLTQNDLADVTGMSTVHVNRSLQELRTDGLIELRSRRLAVLDHARLAALAIFDPAYLHHRKR